MGKTRNISHQISVHFGAPTEILFEKVPLGTNLTHFGTKSDPSLDLPHSVVRGSDGDGKNSNIITIVNNSIDFEKNLLDTDRIDSFSPPSSSSSNNSSFLDTKDQEADVIPATEVKDGGNTGQGQKKTER